MISKSHDEHDTRTCLYEQRHNISLILFLLVFYTLSRFSLCLMYGKVPRSSLQMHFLLEFGHFCGRYMLIIKIVPCHPEDQVYP